ncbi:ABC transporter permease [Candidatus Bathyarchaeota archaeon]|nr:ABC transporter permease [Candidatus Bathyarchaeota archaeon]
MISNLIDIYKTSFKFRFGFTVIFLMCIMGFILPLFSPVNPRAWYSVPKEQPPSSRYLLGTTTMGRDVFWELCSSIGKSLTIAVITAMIASHVGLLIGLLAGIRGGLLDRFLMFLTDTFIIIPGFILLVVVVTVMKNFITIPLMGAIISIVSWPWPARQVRSMVLSLRERTFVYTARLSGMNTSKILIFELMPHLLGWHLVNFANTILFSIGTEGSLAIFGLSLLSDNTLGVMLYWAINYYALYRGLWWWISTPIATLVLIFISFYLVSIGLSEYLHRMVR